MGVGCIPPDEEKLLSKSVGQFSLLMVCQKVIYLFITQYNLFKDIVEHFSYEFHINHWKDYLNELKYNYYDKTK